MPVVIPEDLPSRETLDKERIPYITQGGAFRQDIIPLEIVLLNLMPDKIQTETQILRALGSTPLQINIHLAHMASHKSKNTAAEHLKSFYQDFTTLQSQNYDGIIITGAPIAHLPFEDVDFWEELCDVMKWADKNVFSNFFICWGAKAALYHRYNLQKHQMKEKLFGLYEQSLTTLFHPIVNGFDAVFKMPVSCYTQIRKEEVIATPALEILAGSSESGPALLYEQSRGDVYLLHHPEYDRYTLAREYQRDKNEGLNTAPPKNYLDNREKALPISWRAHRHLLFANWINTIYQHTPFNRDDIPQMRKSRGEEK